MSELQKQKTPMVQAELVEPPIANIERRTRSVAAPLVVPPGWPPDVHTGDTIFASHMNAVRDSVYAWPGDVDAQGHNLLNAANINLNGALTYPFQGGTAWNAKLVGGVWRYVAAGVADAVSTAADGVVRVYGAPAGAADAAITFVEIAGFSLDRVRINKDISQPLGVGNVWNATLTGGTWNYIFAGAAGIMRAEASAVKVYTAPAGAAGGAVAFSEAVSIAANSVAFAKNIESPYSTSIGHSFNLTWDGSAYRYIAAQPGFVVRADSAFRILAAQTGSVGGVATLTEALTVTAVGGVQASSMFSLPTNIGQGFNANFSSANYRYIGAGVAALQYIDSTVFQLRVADSGTAGSAITWANKLTANKDNWSVYSDKQYNYPSSANDYIFQYFYSQGAILRYAIGADVNSYAISRCDASGNILDTPFSLARGNGNLTLGKYLILTTRTAAADDSAAASAGVPVGGIYHNAGALRVRLA